MRRAELFDSKGKASNSNFEVDLSKYLLTGTYKRCLGSINFVCFRSFSKKRIESEKSSGGVVVELLVIDSQLVDDGREEEEEEEEGDWSTTVDVVCSVEREFVCKQSSELEEESKEPV